MHRFVQTAASKSLVEHLKGEFSPEDGYFNFAADRLHLAVSGDLTYSADPAEFADVSKFLDELCTSLQISKDRVVIAPGNHDVNWNAARYKLEQRLDDYLVFLRDFYGRTLAEKLYPKVDWNLGSGDKRDPSDIFGVHELCRGMVQAVSLNSCLLEDQNNHWGFVGELQLDKVRKNLLRRPQAATNPTRIAVVHHHLHPFPESYNAKSKEPWLDVSLVRDSGLLERWMEEDCFSIVMHGHKHKPQLRETIIHGYRDVKADGARPLIVCGAGSAGVDSRELEHHVGNHYQVIELLRVPRVPAAGFVKVTWSELPIDSDITWKKSPPWVIQG
jgi:3',5'-cyclic AMP phosphodiesterase CpdA